MLVFHSLIQKFEQTGSVLDDRVGKTGHPTTAATEKNIDVVQHILKFQPETSIRTVGKAIGLSKSTVQRIMRDILLRGLIFIPTKFS